MRDIEEVRQNDITNGRFDIYFDDLDFDAETFSLILGSNVIRLSEINPETVSEQKAYEHIKEMCKYLKSVVEDIFVDGYRVTCGTVEEYIKLIIKAKHKNMEVLHNITGEKFFKYDILRLTLLRDIIVRYYRYTKNSIHLTREQYEAGELSFSDEITKMEEFMDYKKKHPTNFRDNIKFRLIDVEDDSESEDDIFDLDDLYNVDKLTEN